LADYYDQIGCVFLPQRSAETIFFDRLLTLTMNTAVVGLSAEFFQHDFIFNVGKWHY